VDTTSVLVSVCPTFIKFDVRFILKEVVVQAHLSHKSERLSDSHTSP
jgi:hypothetical protein